MSVAEAHLVRWMLEHGEAGAASFLPVVDELRVVRGCPCGCASIDFTEDCSGEKAIIADFGLEPPNALPGGVFLFTRGGRLAGLEVYSSGDPITFVPEPRSLIPLPSA